MKFVRFNLSLAGFRRGQIIPYHELPPGQQFWVDKEDILGSERIAHFCDKDGKIIEPGDELEESIDLADEVVEEVDVDETAPDETVPEEVAPEETADDETVSDETASEETEEATDEKKLDFDFMAKDDKLKQAETEAADETCLGVKADGSGCNNRAGDSGYCFRHINQA